MAGERAVIYVTGDDDSVTAEAERRCYEYAERFGWSVQKSIRVQGSSASLRALSAMIPELGIEIILTGSLDMTSADQNTRDRLMMMIERGGAIIHPVSGPGKLARIRLVARPACA